jgi:hypothetical protein
VRTFPVRFAVDKKRGAVAARASLVACMVADKDLILIKDATGTIVNCWGWLVPTEGHK